MLATWGTSTGRNPTLDLQFAGATSLDNRITFSRGTTATYFNSAGVLSTAGTSDARFDYNPSTLAARGLLIEEQRTNSIRNNTMQGAVAGTPGTLPTNWVRFVSGTGATAVIGTGTESGIAYIDVRFTGGNTDGISFFIDGTTGHAALNGQTWTGSSYYKLIAGSFANVTANHAVYEANAAGTALAVSNISLATITSAGLATQRLTITRTNNNASTAEEQLAVVCTGTGVFDLTLRIGLPQLEQGAFATSVIPTTTTALTRNADVASMTGTNFSSWYNQSEGTLLAQVIYNADTSCKVVFINDGTYNNIFSLQREVSLDRWQTDIFSAASRQALLNFATNSASVGSVSKCASVYKVNDFAGSANGGAVITDTSGLVQASVDRLALGRDNVGSAEFLNGYIQRIYYYPLRNTNAQLQALTGT